MKFAGVLFGQFLVKLPSVSVLAKLINSGCGDGLSFFL